jgi:hypothetical protein
MLEIAIDLLAMITGAGESTTDVNVGPFRYHHSTSDYQTCVDAGRESARHQFPDTRRWYHFGFTSDHNAQARGRAEAENLRMCGPPPRN